ncbi:MAG: hypothetical protein ABW203_03255 [Novosphingobium sp.]
MFVSFHPRVPLSLAALALVAAAASPAQAQFGGLMGAIVGAGRSKPAPAATDSSDTCPSGKKKNKGAAIVGSIAGTMASRVGGKFASFVPLPEFASLLTTAFACQLEPDEQKQAANATVEATRGDAKVGQTVQWKSTKRDNVSGRSTVTARNDADPSGLQCITVSDVAIVNGEETTANKRMCRPKGSARYSLMA